jgi:hypothetical protein
MSTAVPLLNPEDVSDFCKALREWPNSETANEKFALAVGPFTTFYFHYEAKRYVESSVLLVDLHEEIESLLGRPYLIGTHPDSERPHPYGSKRLPDRREFARNTRLNKNFLFKVTDEKNPLSSPGKAAYFWRASTWDGETNNAYSYVQVYFGWQWWLDHQEEWRQFVLTASDRLVADQVYSGFAMTNPLDTGARYEVSTWERALSTQFFGLDIDSPFGMSMELQEGIRPPTWGFLLSNRWRDKLGLSRAQVLASLDDPQIRVIDRDCGQWIELGGQPSLCPVDNGLPPLQMRLNRLLRPIRVRELGLVGFGQWDGDPNERFNHVDSQRWLARFDEDGDWPSAELRVPAKAVATDARPAATRAGQPCPREGWWVTPAKTNSRRLFKASEVMPDVGGDYGATIWQWDEKQG